MSAKGLSVMCAILWAARTGAAAAPGPHAIVPPGQGVKAPAAPRVRLMALWKGRGR
ncbi:hypothetical protein GCM10007886_45880 [Methylobacterium gregans]|nr:hypothetical protein GCM10007886_45880 [Methylobacterium gregans]